MTKNELFIKDALVYNEEEDLFIMFDNLSYGAFSPEFAFASIENMQECIKEIIKIKIEPVKCMKLLKKIRGNKKLNKSRVFGVFYPLQRR
jgi:hypothetical protein